MCVSQFQSRVLFRARLGHERGDALSRYRGGSVIRLRVRVCSWALRKRELMSRVSTLMARGPGLGKKYFSGRVFGDVGVRHSFCGSGRLEVGSVMMKLVPWIAVHVLRVYKGSVMREGSLTRKNCNVYDYFSYIYLEPCTGSKTRFAFPSLATSLVNILETTANPARHNSKKYLKNSSLILS